MIGVSQTQADSPRQRITPACRQLDAGLRRLDCSLNAVITGKQQVDGRYDKQGEQRPDAQSAGNDQADVKTAYGTRPGSD